MGILPDADPDSERTVWQPKDSNLVSTAESGRNEMRLWRSETADTAAGPATGIQGLLAMTECE